LSPSLIPAKINSFVLMKSRVKMIPAEATILIPPPGVSMPAESIKPVPPQQTNNLMTTGSAPNQLLFLNNTIDKSVMAAKMPTNVSPNSVSTVNVSSEKKVKLAIISGTVTLN